MECYLTVKDTEEEEQDKEKQRNIFFFLSQTSRDKKLINDRVFIFSFVSFSTSHMTTARLRGFDWWSQGGGGS